MWPVKLWRFTWLPSIVLYTWPASGISVTCYASVRHLNLRTSASEGDPPPFGRWGGTGLKDQLHSSHLCRG